MSITRIRRRTIGCAIAATAILAAGCAKAPVTTPVVGSNTVATTTAQPEPLPCEVSQAVPPPTQVASNPKTIEVVQSLPPKPAHVTHKHRTLHLVKYEQNYFLQDDDNHDYPAARDPQGHYYPSYVDPTNHDVYPLYYDPDRDDYYRASCDSDHHYFRCYEDEPSYVYYYDSDPVWYHHRGYYGDCEPIVYAPSGNVEIVGAIPLLIGAFFLLQPERHDWFHSWNNYGGNGPGVAFVQINNYNNRQNVNYYISPGRGPRVFANQLYAQRPALARDPAWYSHAAPSLVASRQTNVGGGYAARGGVGAQVIPGGTRQAFAYRAGSQPASGFGGTNRGQAFNTASRPGTVRAGMSPRMSAIAGRAVVAGAAVGAAHVAMAHAANVRRANSVAHAAATRSATAGRVARATAAHNSAAARQVGSFHARATGSGTTHVARTVRATSSYSTRRAQSAPARVSESYRRSITRSTTSSFHSNSSSNYSHASRRSAPQSVRNVSYSRPSFQSRQSQPSRAPAEQSQRRSAPAPQRQSGGGQPDRGRRH